MVKTLELNAELLKGKNIAVAVSGGRDSMALLHLFSKSNLSFFAVNIEHGIRGAESLSDSKFVADFCQKNNIRIKSFSVDALAFSSQKHMTLEQSARELRYQIFDSLLSFKECDLIALAHHLDDQAETVLMRILRGTGLHGLSGMEQSRKDYIRPLLNFSRSEIDDYIKNNNVPYVDDATNDNADPNRNFLRLEIFPQIEKRYPAYRETFSRLARNAHEADSFISSYARVPKYAYNDAVRICAPYPPSVVFKKEIMLGANALGVFQDIEECHFNALFELQTAQTSKQISLAHGLLAIKEPDSILLVKDNDFENINIPFNLQKLPLTIQGCLYRYTIQSVKDKLNLGADTVDNTDNLNSGELAFDGDKLPQNCTIRYRKEGDRFTKFGGGTKSLGDFLTDKKVSLFVRDRIPVCAEGNDIMFIFGVEISDKIKVTETTKNIIKITQEKL